MTDGRTDPTYRESDRDARTHLKQKPFPIVTGECLCNVAGPDFSYQLAPRAKIFRRDAANVKDMASMKAIMRYNDFPNDKYSGG